MLIFLDIDGVMVPAKNWKIPKLLDDGFPAFNPKAIEVIQSLMTPDTIIMLTTSHKSKFSIEEWKCIFKKRGLTINNIKRLEENTFFLNKKDEILNWFNSNNTNEELIIIDDDTSLNDLPPFLKNKLILTSPLIGLNDNHLNEIKNILNQNL